jgi:hypothetical protein
MAARSLTTRHIRFTENLPQIGHPPDPVKSACTLDDVILQKNCLDIDKVNSQCRVPKPSLEVVKVLAQVGETMGTPSAKVMQRKTCLASGIGFSTQSSEEQVLGFA